MGCGEDAPKKNVGASCDSDAVRRDRLRPDAVTLQELGGWPAILGSLTSGRDLTTDEAAAAMADIFSGDASPAQIAGFIIALRMKGETVDEMAGMLAAMQDASDHVHLSDLE